MEGIGFAAAHRAAAVELARDAAIAKSPGRAHAMTPPTMAAAVAIRPPSIAWLTVLAGASAGTDRPTARVEIA